MRGAVSLAAALAVPVSTDAGDPFPGRDLILWMTFCVILATLVFQGLTLPALIRVLGVHDDGEEERREELKARISAAAAALERIEELEGEEWVRPETLERMRGQYRYRKRRFAAQAGKIEDEDGIEDQSQGYQRASREVITAQRRVLVDLRNRGTISNDVMHRIERELDLEDSRLELPPDGRVLDGRRRAGPKLGSPDGPVRHLHRHRGVGADGRARHGRDADLARRRALARRLRRGHPAPAAALGARAGRPRRAPHHPPRTATTTSACRGSSRRYGLRGRERPLRLVGPRGLARLMETLRPVIGRLPFVVELQEVDEREVSVAWRGEGFELRAFPTRHSVASVGYALVEEDRPGAFDLDAARALGVPEGPDFGVLQRGGEVTTPAGDVVRPDQVLGRRARSGRTVVISGDTEPCAGTLEAAAGAAVLVHEATFLDEERDRARETRHSTAREAAALAREAEAGLLALTHLSSRFLPREVRAEAEAVFPNVLVPRDFDQIEVPFPERGEPIVHPAKGGGERRGGSDVASEAPATVPPA